jgi:hypothetical protein
MGGDAQSKVKSNNFSYILYLFTRAKTHFHTNFSYTPIYRSKKKNPFSHHYDDTYYLTLINFPDVWAGTQNPK